jgi:RimJ/RimL family protein N-acetyltransferase
MATLEIYEEAEKPSTNKIAAPNAPWVQPDTLTGTRLQLEVLTAAHGAGVLTAADDPAIFQWLPMAPPTSREEAAEMIRFCRDRDRSWAFAQRDLRSGRIVGTTGFHDMDPDQRTVSIGPVWFSTTQWGSGLNVESNLILLNLAFDVLGAVRVAWIVDTCNERSAGATRRLGAIHEGVLRKQRMRRDKTWRDVHVFSVLDTEWPAMRRRLIEMMR